jgi:dipeptidyl aminopeptidase/acylaminoacyl peptidase
MTAFFRGWVLGCALVCALAADPGQAAAVQDAIAEAQARTVPAVLPRDAFLRSGNLPAVRLAPAGGRIAALREEGERRSLWLLAPGETRAKRLLARTRSDSLQWSRDGRWLFLPSAEQVDVLGVAPLGAARTVTRLDPHLLHEVIGPDPSRDDALLLLEQTRRSAPVPRSRLLRLDTQGRREVLHEDSRPILDAALSPDGKSLRLRVLATDRHLVLAREADGRLRELMACVQLERCRLLAAGDDGHTLLASDAGAGFVRLLRLEADGRMQMLHTDPRGEADLADTVLDPATGEPLVAIYRGTGARQLALSPLVQAPLAALQAALPGRALDLQVSADGWLVGENDSTLAATRWHRYDPRSGERTPVLADIGIADAPDEALLARKHPVSWIASDGMRLHGYLVLPPGRDPATVPLLTSVHGGPWSLAGPEYSGLTQFFVNRGYAVFLPNFRGSTGLGRDYLLAADGDFGDGRVLRDIVEGTRFVLDQGVGDPRRVAIQGGSFGGYAALLAASRHPELFQLALAAAPPPDFGWATRWAITGSDLSRANGLPLETMFRLLSVDVADAGQMAKLAAESPLALAPQLRRPVLVFAGGRDERVAIRSVTHYAAKLRNEGKDVTLFIQPDAGHALDADLTREAYFYLAESLLHRHLAGPAPAPPSAPLKAHLRRHLRLPAAEAEGAVAAP